MALPVVPRIFPVDSDQAISTVLPISLEKFFASHFNRDMLRLNHTETHFDPTALWRRDDFASNIAALQHCLAICL